jgi:two-component system sensor histidine kinase MtrB
VVALAISGSLLVVAAASAFLLNRVTDGIIVRAQESVLADADQAIVSIEQSLAGADQALTTGRMYDIAQAAIQRMEGECYISFWTESGGIISTAGFDVAASLPPPLIERVGEQPTLVHATPTRVWADGRGLPGQAVGTAVRVGANSLAVFFACPLEREAQTLGDVRTALVIFSLALVLGVGLVSFAVARLAMRPIRAARLAAERLAAGELTERMPVRGTDDLARLAVSMNHMAHQLQSRIRDLEQLSRLQHRFVSDVSHELRTPLTTVRLAADVLYEGRGDFKPIAARSAVLLHREVDRFEALLADLLEISRFDAGAAVLSLDEIDLVELVKAEITALGQVAQKAGVAIRLQADGPALCQVDVRRVARLLRNLLSNAIAHGEGRPINVTVAADEQCVAFAVRDHGVGFTLDEEKQLFNRFWRADPSRTRSIGGTGLGLAISQEDVRLHQGWINVWGRPERGAQFRVTLPRRPDEVVTRSPLPLVPSDAAADEPATNQDKTP